MLNSDFNKRDHLIFHEDYNEDKYPGGIRDFDSLSPDTLRVLIADNYTTAKSSHNGSPAIEDFLDYTNRSDRPDKIVFGGFVESANRQNSKVVITSIAQDFISAKDIVNFASWFHHADEFRISETYGYAWWD